MISRYQTAGVRRRESHGVACDVEVASEFRYRGSMVRGSDPALLIHAGFRLLPKDTAYRPAMDGLYAATRLNTIRRAGNMIFTARCTS